MPEENTTATPAREKVTVITSAVAKEKYPVRKGFKTANGGTVRDSGDAVAVALRGKGIEDWLALAEANGRGDDLRKTAEALRGAADRLDQILGKHARREAAE